MTLDVKRRLYITLVVKQQNRKKHNSNRLFFDVFSQVRVKLRVHWSS